MSHFHDQYFESRVNAADADNDAAEAYYRQKEVDEAQEAEHNAMLDADEAAHDWLDNELEMMKAATPTEAEEMFNKAMAEIQASTARLESLSNRLSELEKAASSQMTEIQELLLIAKTKAA